ncbi:MAG TPA: tetratricopeptide repeat protein [Ottowia sp.]|uniref:tetratricopeptide repeat protein n=1 Tax=Ottowia sp. TaxID=1898956 RepID=UPI002CF6C83F|nr:tetratricopeptide repeat protein [Ottowia sp.]HMN21635.1 tetratricopeptide repeat protein [Ottowia sp.]
MQRILRILAGTAVAWASLPGCVQMPHESAAVAAASAPVAAPVEASAAATPPQSRLDARLMYELLLGEFSFSEGDTSHASAYMLDAARRTGEPALYKRAVDMAIQSRSGPAALEAVRAWRLAVPDSAEARRYELQVLLALGRAGETADALRAVLDTLAADEREPFIIALPALYQRAPDKSEAAHAIELGLAEAVKDPALAPAAWTTIGRMRLQTGDRAGALAAATLGADADAASQWPALLALQLLAGADEARAEALIQRHLARPDARPDLQLAYVRALVTLGRLDDARTQLTELITRRPDEADGWLTLGLLQAEQREDDQAERSLQRYLALMRGAAGAGRDPSTGPSQARLALARIAERGGDLDQAERWLSAVDAPDQVLAAQIQRADLLARKGQIAQARQAIRAAPEQDEGDARVKLLAEAQLLREHGDAAESYRLLQGALRDSPDDDGLLYDAAMSAERLNRLAEMERLLRRVIALKPDSAHAYNALGYALADRNQRLAEARSLIEKAARLDPNDAYIQDSLGWVEFRLGQPRKARMLLEAAFRKRPDAEIAAHLGEVLWALGEQEAARQVWREGLRLDPDNASLQRTLQRLRVQP